MSDRLEERWSSPEYYLTRENQELKRKLSEVAQQEQRLKEYEGKLRDKEITLLKREGLLLDKEQEITEVEEIESLVSPTDILAKAGVNPANYKNPKKLQLLIRLSDPTEDININELAAELDIHRTTVYRWKSSPQFIQDQNRLLDNALSAMYGVALRTLYRNLQRGSDRALSIYFELTNRIRQGNNATFNNVNVEDNRSNEAILAEIEELKKQLGEI